MKFLKKGLVLTMAAIMLASTATLAACGGNNGNGGKTEKTPFIKEVVILTKPETDYLVGDIFTYDDFALQEVYSDGSRKNIVSGFEFTRKKASVLVDKKNYIYEDQDVALDAPLTTNDTEIYITYNTTCQGYNLTYNLTQPLSVKDPSDPNTEIFMIGDASLVYFYGDGRVESYGIQYAPYKQYDACRNDGFWSWNGSELVIAMKNYNPNISENADDEYRELIITKVNGGYTFKFEWAAQGENVGTKESPVYKTYTYNCTISAELAARRLTSNRKYGDQNLKGKYSKQTDNVKG